MAGTEVRRPSLAAAVAALLIALAIGACGGGSSTTDGPETGITETATAIFTSADPEDCERLYTQAALEQRTRKEGAEAVARCRETAAEGEPAESVEVSDIAVSGDSATATATPSGGTTGGIRLDLSLVDDGGTWKVDHLDDAEILDRSQLQKGTTASLGDTVGEQITRSQARCIVRYVNKVATDRQLERSLLGESRSFAYDAISACLGDGIDLVALIKLTRNQLGAAGVDDLTADCISGLMVAFIKKKHIRLEDFAEDEQVNLNYQDALIKATRRCAGA